MGDWQNEILQLPHTDNSSYLLDYSNYPEDYSGYPDELYVGDMDIPIKTECFGFCTKMEMELYIFKTHKYTKELNEELLRAKDLNTRYCNKIKKLQEKVKAQKNTQAAILKKERENLQTKCQELRSLCEEEEAKSQEILKELAEAKNQLAHQEHMNNALVTDDETTEAELQEELRQQALLRHELQKMKEVQQQAKQKQAEKIASLKEDSCMTEESLLRRVEELKHQLQAQKLLSLELEERRSNLPVCAAAIGNDHIAQ